MYGYLGNGNIMQGTNHHGNGPLTQEFFVEKPDVGHRRIPFLNRIINTDNIRYLWH